MEVCRSILPQRLDQPLHVTTQRVAIKAADKVELRPEAAGRQHHNAGLLILLQPPQGCVLLPLLLTWQMSAAAAAAAATACKQSPACATAT